MKRGVVLVVVATVGLLVVGTVRANRPHGVTHVSATITHDGDVAVGGGRFLLTGYVKSRRQSCRGLREVVLKAHYANGTTKRLDNDFTSSRGAWAAKANLTGIDRLKAKAIRKEIDTVVIRRHSPELHARLICDPAAVVWRLH